MATLDERLDKLVTMATGEARPRALDRLNTQAEGMANREMRQCTRCTEIKPLQAFFDPALRGGAGGQGRVCMACKEADKAKAARPPPNAWSRRRRWG